VVITDVNEQRLALARRLGVDLAVDVSRRPLAEVQRELDMHEGFDVGLEMSGNPAALREMIANMCHGGQIAILGIPSADGAIDWSEVVTKMLTLQGIYGREMFETWYKMGVMIEGGLDITPVITHRFPADEFEQGFRAMDSGNAGKVILDWKIFH
jgi:threonine 3-dehydrogenase